MSTRLEELIERIDPSNIIDRVSIAVDEAFNSFRYDRPIESFDDYQEYMTEFVQHIEQIVIGFRTTHPVAKDFFWGRYSTLVNKKQGPDAWKMNYEKVLTGKGGGTYQLLKDVAAMILEEQSGRQISTKVWNFWNSLDNDEKLDTVDEFLRKFGRILPSEYTSGAYLKINFPQVLEKYPQLLLEIRRAVR